MDFNIADKYQEETKRTAPTSFDEIGQLINYTMGLCGESAEVLALVNNKLSYNKEINKDELTKELGDLMWYIARCADGIGFKLSYLLGTKTFDEYQSESDFDMEVDYAVIQLGEINNVLRHYTMVLSIDSGYISDHFKKVVFQGHKIDFILVKDKLESILRCIGIIAYLNKIWFSEIANKNVEKLRKRYPNGFKVDDSINRKE